MRRPLRNSSGFNLVELMVVVAIIGILAAIAVPIYSKQVERSRMKEGINKLLELQGAMEQFRGIHRRYASDVDELATNINLGLKPGNKSEYYTFVITHSAGNFTIKAIAINENNVPEMGKELTVTRNGDVEYYSP